MPARAGQINEEIGLISAGPALAVDVEAFLMFRQYLMLQLLSFAALTFRCLDSGAMSSDIRYLGQHQFRVRSAALIT